MNRKLRTNYKIMVKNRITTFRFYCKCSRTSSSNGGQSRSNMSFYKVASQLDNLSDNKSVIGTYSNNQIRVEQGYQQSALKMSTNATLADDIMITVYQTLLKR